MYRQMTAIVEEMYAIDEALQAAVDTAADFNSVPQHADRAFERLQRRTLSGLRGDPGEERVVSQLTHQREIGREGRVLRQGGRSAAEAVSRRIEQLITQRDREQFSEKRANIERSEAISHFINGIIHDFNNLIFAVSGKLSLMSRKSSDPEMTTSMEEVRGLVSDAGGILQRLIRAGRLGLDDVTSIDPWSEMSQIMRTAQRLLPRRISFDYTLEDIEGIHERCIEAVPQTLQQLVLNLVVNARDAIGTDGQIRVEGKPSEDREWFVVTVHDDGPGIPEDEYDNVFKPFYKIDKGRAETKSSVGLGLSIASDIIRSHGGNIKLEKSNLNGLGVRIFLPV